jgi:hypothetical protein
VALGVAEREVVVSKLSWRHGARDAAFNVLTGGRIKKLEAKRDQALSERDAAAAERDTALSERDAAAAERDTALSERDAAVAERDKALSERDAKAALIAEREQSLNRRDLVQYYKSLESDPNQTFLYLDTKSLPRSGLHFLKSTMRRLFGQHFSFCEWYQEPGCCKSMPCTLTNFLNQSQFHIRMVKSHDLQLSDPFFGVDPRGKVRRIVLVRHPLYILTSWWCLDFLAKNRQLLARYGIDINKIHYKHEKPVIEQANHILNQLAVIPSYENIKGWIHDKEEYITAFLDKWANSEGAQVVHYDKIPDFIDEFVADVDAIEGNPKNREGSLARHNPAISFVERKSPYVGPYDTATAALEKHSQEFRRASERIVENDKHGVFR